jgi:molybdopterin converting factor small subunit
MEPTLLEMHSLLLGPVYDLDSPKFFELAAEFNTQFNGLLALYADLIDDEEKVPAKAVLKFCQDIMEYVSYFARFEEILANPEHEVTAGFLKIIEEREELVATKYRILAERELAMFHNADFRQRLSDNLERMMGL